MSEFYLQNPDLSQPPIVTEAEANIIAEARNAIEAMRNPEEGPAYDEYVFGVTADRTVVSIDLPKGGKPRDMENGVVRIGHLDEMMTGSEPTVQPLKWVAPVQGGRLNIRTTSEIAIGVPSPEDRGNNKHPTIGGKPIFTVNSDGYPWETAPKPVVEQIPNVEPVTAAPEQVATGGIFRQSRRRTL